MLAQSPQHADLLAALGVTPMTPGDLLAEVLPAWQELAQEARDAALRFTCTEWHTLQANEALVAQLRQLVFVPSCGPGLSCCMSFGSISSALTAVCACRCCVPPLLTEAAAAADQELRYKAADLYDPSNTLLATIFEGQPVFPSSEFATPEWLKVPPLPVCLSARRHNVALPTTLPCHAQVLKAVGLQSEIDTALYLTCAREVDSRGKQLSAGDAAARLRTMAAARALAAHLDENASVLHSNELYSGLAPLAVAPATRVRIRLHVLPA